jgi:hypothetical protein
LWKLDKFYHVGDVKKWRGEMGMPSRQERQDFLGIWSEKYPGIVSRKNK